MTLAQKTRNHFVGMAFGAPCTRADLAGAERRLGHPLPEDLWDLHLAFNGFLGPTAAPFFQPLLESMKDGPQSIVGYTLFLRDEFPEIPWVQRVVIFGNDGCGLDWGICLDDPHDIFEWRADRGGNLLVVGRSPLDAWLQGLAGYADLGIDV